MELVTQPEGSSQCGQCVISMLTGRPLSEVVEVAGVGRNYPAQLRQHAMKFGLELAKRSQPIVDGRGPEGRRGAVFMFHPAAHWVAWDGERFYDPRGAVLDTLPVDSQSGIYLAVEAAPGGQR